MGLQGSIGAVMALGSAFGHGIHNSVSEGQPLLLGLIVPSQMGLDVDAVADSATSTHNIPSSPRIHGVSTPCIRDWVGHNPNHGLTIGIEVDLGRQVTLTSDAPDGIC